MKLNPIIRRIRFVAAICLCVIVGLAILLMLKNSGLHFTQLESSIIVGLPAMVGIMATFAIL